MAMFLGGVVGGLLGAQKHASSDKGKKEREEFGKVLEQDSCEVVGKLMAGVRGDLEGVVREVVAQCAEFWGHQLHKAEEAKRLAVEELQAQLAAANEQLADTVRAYNQVVGDLQAQVAEAREAADASGRMAEAKAAAAAAQAAAASAAAVEAARAAAAVQGAGRDESLRLQQQKLAMVTAMDAASRENAELRAQLKQAREALAGSEARCAKLTSLSQHLLAKQAAASHSGGGAKHGDKDKGAGAAAVVVAGATAAPAGPSTDAGATGGAPAVAAPAVEAPAARGAEADPAGLGSSTATGGPSVAVPGEAGAESVSEGGEQGGVDKAGQEGGSAGPSERTTGPPVSSAAGGGAPSTELPAAPGLLQPGDKAQGAPTGADAAGGGTSQEGARG